jgi:hypothetical protein
MFSPTGNKMYLNEEKGAENEGKEGGHEEMREADPIKADKIINK